MARRAYELKKEKGILSVPNYHCNKGMSLLVKENVKPFYEDDDYVQERRIVSPSQMMTPKK